METYLIIVEAYAMHYKLNIAKEELREKAFQWAGTRGARSGRVAWQFIQDLGGKMGKCIV
jgi:predicted AAA+ superfamily ATPase